MAYGPRHGHQPDGGADDDGALAESGQDGVEEVGAPGPGAAHELAGSGHDLDLGDVVGLGVRPVGLAAQAADGEFEVVGEDGRREAVGRRRLGQLAPSVPAPTVTVVLRGPSEPTSARGAVSMTSPPDTTRSPRRRSVAP
ncbi:hypothetical protein AB0C70_10370 [Streptomyces sp. NPDC048564]|uniref:hypothetical protein n=1 Tax=Streptomyces sp. NPDC048564 TaxID=3155760 RepID=UPI00341C7763